MAHIKKLTRWNWEGAIAILAVIGLSASLLLHYGIHVDPYFADLPLFIVLLLGGIPLVYTLLKNLFRGEFGSDLLAGISIVTAVFLDEYAAGTLVVLMLSGGEALEKYAVKQASSVLSVLAKRMPHTAHRRRGGKVDDISLSEVKVDDEIVVFPHNVCPVDGVVIDGRSVMDESYLTGEPFEISKTPGSTVISGAVNGQGMLVIKATKLPTDSRYAKIMEVMRRAESERKGMRRLGDILGAWYTPLALVIALIAWIATGDPVRFLSVLVVATPCPLLIAIPITIIGAISLCAKRGIIVKDPAALEQLGRCQTMILDKTGTLTYGHPKVTDVVALGGASEERIIQYAGSIERYSKHPLAASLVNLLNERRLIPLEISQLSELPGQGLRGTIGADEILITSRKVAVEKGLISPKDLPEIKSGMECCVIINNRELGVVRFHDAPRADSKMFIKHLPIHHRIKRILIVSGDRESEVRYLAEQVGITEIYASQTPEQKVERVKNETKMAKTIFVGDGINDAPALMSATVGVAFGQNSDITSEAAAVVLLDSSLTKLDEFFHISKHMMGIALQSAIGGMILSIVGMGFAAFGIITPVMGAIIQEGIDLFAVVNSLRVAKAPRELTDYK